jgi:hypothetical protein
MLWKQGADRTKGGFGDERMSLFDLCATLRVLYPGKWVEPYFKLALGFSIPGPPDAAQNGNVTLDPGFGMTYQIRLGALLTFPYTGFFAEAGFFATPWFPGDGQVRDDDGDPVAFDQIQALEAGLLINFGLVTLF